LILSLIDSETLILSLITKENNEHVEYLSINTLVDERFSRRDFDAIV